MDRNKLDLRFKDYYNSYLNSSGKKSANNSIFRTNGSGQNYMETEHFFSNNDNISCNFHINRVNALIPHFHDFFEIVYVYCGTIVHHIDTTEFIMNQGDICIINPNRIHCLSKFDTNTLVLNILIRKEFLNNAFIQLYSADDIIFNFLSECLIGQNEEANILFHGKDHEYILDLLHHLIIEFFEKRTKYDIAIEHYLQLFCLELTRLYASNETQNQNSMINDTSIEPLMNYIINHFRTVSIGSIAENFHYHPTYIPQLLKKHTGKTFMEILQMIRITAAKEKLVNTSLSIDNISNYIGYSNSTHFCRIFNNQTGMSPSQYRKTYSHKKQDE